MTTLIDSQCRLAPVLSLFRTLEFLMAEPASHIRLPATPSPTRVYPIRTSREEPTFASSMIEGSPTTTDIQTAVSVGTTVVTSVTLVGTTGSLRDPVFSSTASRISVEAGTSLANGSPATPSIGVTAGTTTVTLESTTVVSTVPLSETGPYPFVSHV